MELVLQIGGQSHPMAEPWQCHDAWRPCGLRDRHEGVFKPLRSATTPTWRPAVVLQVNGTGVADFYLQHLMETPWRPQGGPKVKVMADHRWSLANCNSWYTSIP